MRGNWSTRAGRLALARTGLALSLAAGLGACGEDLAVQNSGSAGNNLSPTDKPSDPPPTLKPGDESVADALRRTDAGEAVKDAEYTEWISKSSVQSTESTGLELADKLAFATPGYATLEEATDNADLVVAGKVVRITFVKSGTLTEFRVRRAGKGSPPSMITVFQDAQLRRDPHNGETYVASLGAAPFMAEGTRAVLLLNEDSDKKAVLSETASGISQYKGPVYVIQNFSGQYRANKNGKVRPVPGNRDKSGENVTEDEIVDRAKKRSKDR